jgi:hypothetical protein
VRRERELISPALRPHTPVALSTNARALARARARHARRTVHQRARARARSRAPRAVRAPAPPQNAPKFLDRIDEGMARTKQSEAAIETAQSHLASVLGERAALPHFESGGGGDASERNGVALQAWLRNLSDVLPELLETMEAETHTLESTLPKTSAHRR